MSDLMFVGMTHTDGGRNWQDVGMTHTDGGRNWQDVPQSHFPVSRHVGRVHMPVSLAGGLQSLN